MPVVVRLSAQIRRHRMEAAGTTYRDIKVGRRSKQAGIRRIGGKFHFAPDLGRECDFLDSDYHASRPFNLHSVDKNSNVVAIAYDQPDPEPTRPICRPYGWLEDGIGCRSLDTVLAQGNACLNEREAGCQHRNSYRDRRQDIGSLPPLEHPDFPSAARSVAEESERV